MLRQIKSSSVLFFFKIISLLKNKTLWLVLASSVLLCLSFSKYNLGFLIWFSLCPFFFSLKNKSRKKRAAIFFILGTIASFFVIFWLIHVSLLGLIATSIYLGLWFGFFGLFSPSPSALSALGVIPLLWVLLEKIRGIFFNGFGWGVLGCTQYKNILLAQSADKIGVSGLTFLIVFINLVFFRCLKTILQGKNLRKNIPEITLSFFVLIVTYSYGIHCLHEKYSGVDLSVSVVQANIIQKQKWDPAFSSINLNKHIVLTREAAKKNPDLIVWPETSVPGYLLDESELYWKIAELSQNIPAHLLIGSPREDYTTHKYYNSAFLFAPGGELKGFYDKIHLVPFGEYLPYKNIFWFLKSQPIADFSAGGKYTVFELPNKQGEIVKFGVLICFEDVFPNLVKKFKARGIDFFINITNEAWFKHSSEPSQHLAMSVFRAIENRCWFIRAANTGISCFIDPYGRVKKILDKNGENIFISGELTQNLSL